MYALALAEQLSEMNKIGSLVNRSGQMNHIVRHGLGSRIGSPVDPVAVGNCGHSLFPIRPQEALGVPGADTHQRGRLVQGHVLCRQAVQNLLLGVNITFSVG